jgi:predicted nuclease of predicted toxin-antitoxin system
MKFLLNMNVPRDLGTRLAAQGHECRHVGDIGMAQASDVAIMEEAR